MNDALGEGIMLPTGGLALELVATHLTSTKLPVSQISGLVGYSEQSVSARSC